LTRYVDCGMPLVLRFESLNVVRLCASAFFSVVVGGDVIIWEEQSPTSVCCDWVLVCVVLGCAVRFVGV
jgi:hypothetical protein